MSRSHDRQRAAVRETVGSTAMVTMSSKRNNNLNNRRNIVKRAANSFARNHPQLGTSWYFCSQSMHWQHFWSPHAPLLCAARVILTPLHPSYQLPFPGATSPPASALSRGSCCPMPFWALFSQRHKPSGTPWRDFQPRAAFPSSSCLTSTSLIRWGLQCRGQAATGSQGNISPCFYVRISASPGEAHKAPASSLPAAPSPPKHISRQKQNKTERAGTQSCGCPRHRAWRTLRWLEGGLPRTASRQGHSTTPYPGAQMQPHRDTPRHQLSSFSLWWHHRRHRAGRPSTLCHRPQPSLPGRGGAPWGRWTRSTPKWHRDQSEKPMLFWGHNSSLGVFLSFKHLFLLSRDSGLPQKAPCSPTTALKRPEQSEVSPFPCSGFLQGNSPKPPRVWVDPAPLPSSSMPWQAARVSCLCHTCRLPPSWGQRLNPAPKISVENGPCQSAEGSCQDTAQSPNRSMTGTKRLPAHTKALGSVTRQTNFNEKVCTGVSGHPGAVASRPRQLNTFGQLVQSSGVRLGAPVHLELKQGQGFTSQRTTGGCIEGKHLGFSAGPALLGFPPRDVRGAECLLASQCPWSLVPLCNHRVIVSHCEKAPGEVRRAKTCSYSAIPGLCWEDEEFPARLFCRDWGSCSELAEVWEQLETPFWHGREPHAGILKRKTFWVKLFFCATFFKFKQTNKKKPQNFVKCWCPPRSLRTRSPAATPHAPGVARWQSE